MQLHNDDTSPEYLTAMRFANGETLGRVELRDVEIRLVIQYLSDIKNRCNAVKRQLKEF